MPDLPLSGIRVCDLTWIIAGPTATRVLADFGADVIRVEHQQAIDPIRVGRPINGERMIDSKNEPKYPCCNIHKIHQWTTENSVDDYFTFCFQLIVS